MKYQWNDILTLSAVTLLGCGGLAAAQGQLADTSPTEAPTAQDQSPAAELGKINWHRDFEKAAAESGKTGKPLMVVFGELPGCGGCKNYGLVIFSNPLFVEVAETLFVPLFIRNNDPVGASADTKLLMRFKEQANTYPIIRFMNAEGEDVTPATRNWRFDQGGWGELLGNTVKALEVSGKEVPKYLEVFTAEYGAWKTAKVCFAMGCYWSGEAKLGALPGVVRTRIGYHKLAPSANEIVEVIYDTERADYNAIVKAAKTEKCAQWVILPEDDPNLGAAREVFGESGVKVSAEDCIFKDGDPNYQMRLYRQPGFYFNCITPLQATRMHGDNENAASYLSPQQKVIHGRINALFRQLDEQGQKDLFARMKEELNPSQYRNLYKGSLNEYHEKLLAFLDKLEDGHRE